MAAVFALSTLGLPKAFGTKCAADETEGPDGDFEVYHESLGFEMFCPPLYCGAGGFGQ